MSYSGFVQAGTAMGLESLIIRPVRGIYGPQLNDGTILGDIVAQATLEEKHQDELEVTEHPVEQGAAIVDHAFKRPAEVILHLGWSNSPSSAGSLVAAGAGLVSAVSPVAAQLTNAYGLVTGIRSTLAGGAADKIQAMYQALLQLQETRALFVIYTGKRVYTNMICKSLMTETDSKTENSLLITVVCKQVILVNTETKLLSKNKVSNPKLNASPLNLGKKSATLVGLK
jgi:hypothetical protein